MLYQIDNGSPVVLLYGSVPVWRALDQGDTGRDVSQLNHDLVALGYADRADVVALGWNYYSWETGHGVQLLEGHLGVAWPTGNLSLGQVVFKPQALRVAQVTGSLGGTASGTGADGDVGPARGVGPAGCLRSVGGEGRGCGEDHAAGREHDGGGGLVGGDGAVTSGLGSQAATTIPVSVRLVHPSAAGSLDQAPVTVDITTTTARDALVVPVGALLAEAWVGMTWR